MTTSTPDAWTFVLLALAAFRVYRLIARDTITEPIRAAVTYPDDEAVTLDSRPDRIEVVGEYELAKGARIYLSTLIRCPWCLGAYLSAGAWLLWAWEPRWTTFLATPWALSAAVALCKKTLDP